MPLPMEERKRLQELNMPESMMVRRDLVEYLRRTGLTSRDFAHRIRYSHASINNFIGGRYYEKNKANDLAIRAAIIDFIASNPIAPAYEAEGKLYETANVRALHRIFYECLDKQRAGVIYGGPGSQKTFALEHLIAELNQAELKNSESGRRAYYIYCRQAIRPAQLLKRVAEACGSVQYGDADRLIRNLRFDFGKRRILLVFDEAQHLSIDCLETVRELLDRLGCGLLFAGSHDLIRTFQKSMELEQWNSRIRVAQELPGITDGEAQQIVRAELGNVSESKLLKIVGDSRVPDIRRKNEYISARRLFFGIAAIKEKLEKVHVQ